MVDSSACHRARGEGRNEPTTSTLARHVFYLGRVDNRWRRCLKQRPSHDLSWLAGVLSRVEERRLHLTTCGQDLRRAHTRARLRAARYLGDIAEMDFPTPPPTEEWVARSLDDVNMRRTYQQARLEFERFLHAGTVPGVRLTGGVKDPATMRRKIAAREDGGGGLDLWDNVRLRMTVPDLDGVLTLGRGLVRTFGRRIVRVRNYYVEPRKGPDDPYRAIHFEVRGDDGQCVEMQVMTARREAIGVIDHALVCRRDVPFLDAGHERWLRELSQTANIMDAEPAARLVATAHGTSPRTPRLAARPSPTERVMREPRRVCWDRDGFEYIADWVNDHWEFANKECGDVRWYDVPATPELFDALNASIARGAGARS